MSEARSHAGLASRSMLIDSAILREYDVRGIVGAGLNAEVVEALGRAIGTEAAKHEQTAVAVARDARLTSDALQRALVRGLRASGRDVIDIGRVPTPVLNFATHSLGTGAGVMVTASHNPAEYNGLKIVVGGRTLSGEEIRALGQRVATSDFVVGAGGYRRADVVPAYIERIVGEIALQRPLHVVIDAGNGIAGAVAPALFRALGCRVEALFCELDGRFPNHHPDPTVPANLQSLRERVHLAGADVGLAFDGDGDRLGVVDNAGNIIWPDRQLMLFASDILKRSKAGTPIVYDVKCSSALADVIREHGGTPVMWKAGHSLIREKLRATGAPLGGELTGHLFFADRWYGFDDALYAGARLLELLAAAKAASAEVFAALPNRLSTPELRIDLKPGEPQLLMKELARAHPPEFAQAQVTTIDGVRADFAHGWGLVRASNTTPSLVLRFEGINDAALDDICALFQAWLHRVRADLTVPAFR